MQKIGIGYEDYKRIIDDGCYYVDKTLLIKDIIEKGGMVTLFTRPRRFGKTLALSTIKTFFELEYDRNGNVVDNSRYFIDKKIMDADEKTLSMMGSFPVINLSLKSAKQANFKDAFIQLRNEIAAEYSRHDYLAKSNILDDDEKSLFRSLAAPTLIDDLKNDEDYEKEIRKYLVAIKNLSVLLKKHHEKNVIILLDEYDVPLENAYTRGFYDQMIGFIRSLFESALKTNSALEFAVITGCLRISKESIFTGMNNLMINSIRDTGFEEAFGFTQEETEQVLTDYNLPDKIEEARQWYDGYLFGDREIYNPWSIIHYVYGIVINGRKFPEPYWANTSTNEIIKEMVYNADDNMKRELDTLIKGGTIEKKIHEEITYGDIHESEDNLWNFLFFTGYLKKVSERFEGEEIYVTMTIPNVEIRNIYKNQIKEWFNNKVKEIDHTEFQKKVLAGDIKGMESILTGILKKSISYFDSEESFYHGFLLSMLVGTPDYSVKSNREEGNGRPDIVLYPENPTESAIIFEIKIRKKFNEMEDGLKDAYVQIHDQKYEEGILDDGYVGVVSYGICFCKKSCIIGKYLG